MSANPMPWIILAGVVLASLHFKGYLKLPASKPPLQGAATQSPSRNLEPANIEELVKLGSYVLGLAWSTALKREAETRIADSVAREAGDALMKRFTDPFSGAGPKDPV